MGSLSDAAETALLQLIFNNTAWANVGDASGIQPSATAGTLTVKLYTSACSDSAAGTEANYTGYANNAVARSAGGWTVSGNNVSNTAAVSFGTCTAGSNTITYFAIYGVSTNYILWGAITDPAGGLAVSAGVTPEFAIGALDVNLE
jgi:hypothetical protein